MQDLVPNCDCLLVYTDLQDGVDMGRHVACFSGTYILLSHQYHLVLPDSAFFMQAATFMKLHSSFDTPLAQNIVSAALTNHSVQPELPRCQREVACQC